MQVKKPQGLSITSFLGSTPKDGRIIGLGLGLGLAALSANAQAVVFKVTETVCSALDEFHLPVEAFGDAVIFREAPHRSDGFGPLLEGMSEGLQGSQSAPLQAADKVQQAVDVCAVTGDLWSNGANQVH